MTPYIAQQGWVRLTEERIVVAFAAVNEVRTLADETRDAIDRTMDLLRASAPYPQNPDGPKLPSERWTRADWSEWYSQARER